MCFCDDVRNIMIFSKYQNLYRDQSSVTTDLIVPNVSKMLLLRNSVLRATLNLVPPSFQVGMEMWARYAHKALWHDFEPGWALHKSHHVPRIGPFEDNDIFALANAVPAMGLCAYGFTTPNVIGGNHFFLLPQ